MHLYLLAQSTQPNSPIAYAIYVLILIVMLMVGFWILSLIIKQQRFPLPISFPMLLSLYLQRVPLDLLSDTILILKKHNRYIDLYAIIRIYLKNWEEIETAEDFVKIIAPDIELKHLHWKNENSSTTPPPDKPKQ
ncbi:hypothetical protein JD969_07815 [Planctomycetota bacterium]|nr:hypothetical protein JD969_07815 [Planctomycetota bacterium]